MGLSIRWFHRFEIEHLLARCGLAVEAVYGGFDRRPFMEGSAEMVFLAGKGGRRSIVPGRR